MTSDIGETFWAYSLGVYARPGVAERLIDLQDNLGVDVNIILFCLWCSKTGRGPLDLALFKAIIAASAPWQRGVVSAIRALRRELKPGVPHIPATASNAVREEIKRLEIECERIEQELLAEWAPPVIEPASESDAHAALAAYFAAMGLAESVEIRARVEELVKSCAL